MQPEKLEGWEPLARQFREFFLKHWKCEPLHLQVPLLHGPTVILPMPHWGVPGAVAGGEASVAPQEMHTAPKETLRELIVVQPPIQKVEIPLEHQRIRKAYHSPDWREVHLSGRRWMLSPKQSIIVRVLWEACLEGRADVDSGYLLRKAESDAVRIHDLFRRLHDWDSQLIVSLVPNKYRLAHADRLKEFLEEEAQREEGLIE